MSILHGAPINNPGYYDIPINNQYSNRPPSGNKMNRNEEQNYLINKPMPGYFDPAAFSEDVKQPLMRKKELINDSSIEEFRGGGGGGHGGGGGGGHGGGYGGGHGGGGYGGHGGHGGRG